ncbi:Uncharacterized protein HZ326_24721 [Fusarium oxysporum f. sp. albedinis]|nr:Uncharacterized protein HZ326_24721 [Fusarium oxysporum f. sp. albedinis]
MQIHKRGDVPLLSGGELGQQGFDINESFCILESLPGRSNASSSEGASPAPLSQIDPPQQPRLPPCLKSDIRRATLPSKWLHPKRRTKYSSCIRRSSRGTLFSRNASYDSNRGFSKHLSHFDR